MLRLAVVGTHWITDSFVSAALESGHYQLTAVYSRQLSQAQALRTNMASRNCSPT